MGYLNPIHAYGYECFCRDAFLAGVDGVLLVDMPPEESDEFLHFARVHGLNVIFLLTPTSDTSRIAMVNKLGKGFIYYVTVTGVTGARQELSETLATELSRIKKNVMLPIMDGFGISTPDQAASVAALADGVVVGSAIVKLFQQHSGTKLRTELKLFVKTLKHAISPGAI
jgi:tryptophan synthase alpha chain